MLDYDELEKALRFLKPRTKLYELLKVELTKQGRWKQKPRGRPMERGHDERRK